MKRAVLVAAVFLAVTTTTAGAEGVVLSLDNANLLEIGLEGPTLATKAPVRYEPVARSNNSLWRLARCVKPRRDSVQVKLRRDPRTGTWRC